MPMAKLLSPITPPLSSYRIATIKDQLITRSSVACDLSKIRQKHEHPSHLLVEAIVGDLFRGGADGSTPYYNSNQYTNRGDYNDMGSAQSSGRNLDQGVSPSRILQEQQQQYTNQEQQLEQQQHTYQQPFYGTGEGDFSNGIYNPDEPFYGQRESVEDRLAAWRLQQQVCLVIPCLHMFIHVALFFSYQQLVFTFYLLIMFY